MAELDSLKFEIQDELAGSTRIKVIGVGGGGSNAVGRMMDAGVRGVEFYVMNTDAQALRTSPVPNKIALGARITHGLGAGSDPEIGRQAALEDTDRILEVLEGADMVFVAAGLGGGTGTGAAPVVADLARQLGALTVAVVTKPFAFEGPRRMKQAERGLAELHATVDCVISIPNDRLIELVPPGTSFFEAFRLADDVLRQGVQGISDIITTPGLINRDFADVRAIMVGMGFAIMGTASARGPNAAVEAARAAIACPLLEEGGLEGARAILLNIAASPNLSLHDLHQACQLIKEATGNPDVQINFGLVADASLEDEVRITVIATGFQREGLPDVERPAISIPRPAVQQAPKAAPVAPRILEPPVEEPRPEPAPAALQAEAQPEPEPLEVFDLEPLPKETAAAAGPPPQATPPQAGPPDDIFSFDDLETPPVLKRERKLF